MELDITAIAVTLIAVIGLVLGSKVFLSSQTTGSKYLKLKMKEMEDYNEYLKKQNRTYKSKISGIERGPRIDGDISELGGILPELITQFSNYVPKWLQPFVNDPKAQEWIMKYVQENPDKAKEWFGKIVGKKIAPGEKKDEFDGVQDTV